MHREKLSFELIIKVAVEMNIPVNALMWFAAVLPIAALLILMVRFQWGAVKAAPVGLCFAATSAVIFYKAGGQLLGIEALKAIWNALSIILVIWTAILIYEVTNEAKAFKVLKESMKSITPNELIRVFGVGMVFSSFLQGVTGFGVPVAVTAPLLMGIGVKPLWAVIIPLVGHCWAGTFGTLSIAWQSLLMQTGMADPIAIKQAGLYAGIFIWILNLASGFIICGFYGGKKAIREGFPVVFIISLIQGGGQLLFTQIDQVLACFIPGCIALIALFIISRSKRYREVWSMHDSPVMERKPEEKEPAGDAHTMTIHEAFLPYYIMTAVTLLVLLIKPIKDFLGIWTIAPSFPETITGYGLIDPEAAYYSPLSPLTHAGAFLFLSAACGFVYYMHKGYIQKGAGRRILKRGIRKTIPSGFALMALIIMSRIMSGSGQTAVLASGAVYVLGEFYAVIAPFVGLMGSFMTSSNMSSNILFGNFQQTTAALLHFNTSAVLGAQTAGGALGTSISPGNIILGTTMAGILGSEGIVFKKILPRAAALALVFGILLYISQAVL